MSADDTRRRDGTNPRSEDDLRAAYQLAAQHAPAAQDVLRTVRAVEAAQPRRSRAWAPIAAAAVVVLAIAVPVYALSRSKNDSRSASSAGVVSGQDAKAPAGPTGSGGSQGDAVGGSAPVDPGPVGTVAGIPGAPTFPSAGHTCAPDEVTLALTWTSGGTSLRGTLKATNHTQAACDLLVKPAVVPLSGSGAPLAVHQIQSMEMKLGPSRLLAGASASAVVTWAQWCGTGFGSTATVSWGTGNATATVATDGVHAAACPLRGGEPIEGTISSEFFGPLS